MNIQKLLMILLLLLLLIFIPVQITANPDILVDLRLYKGSYPATAAEPVSITATYHLRSMRDGTLLLNPEASEEMLEIKRIFNLLELKLITQASWGWAQGRTSKQYQAISLDERELFFVLIPLEKSDLFRLEVVENEKKLLETEIILPQERTSVFGFENAAGSPYFISLQRKKDKKMPSEKSSMVASVKRPRLINKVNPEYPQEAVDNGIEGKVVLECTTDKEGGVQKLEVLEGHPILAQAAIDALRKWKYEPFIINNKPEKIMFTVQLNFNLKEKKKHESEALPEKASRLKSTLAPEQLITNLTNKSYTGELLDLEFENADLEEIINFFSTITSLQIQIETGVKGKITCKFSQIPWDKALATILQDNRLELVPDGNRLKVRKSINQSTRSKNNEK